MQVGQNVVNIILGLSGALALGYFVYGGFIMLTSRGNSKAVSDGKTILTQAVIGIIIIFGAYTAVNFIVNALGAGKFFKTQFEGDLQTAPSVKPASSTQQSGGTLTTGQCQCVLNLPTGLLSGLNNTITGENITLFNSFKNACATSSGSLKDTGNGSYLCSIGNGTTQKACSDLNISFAKVTDKITCTFF
jgi:hypothetical protein